MRQCDARPEWIEPADAPTPYDTACGLVLAYQGRFCREGYDRFVHVVNDNRKGRGRLYHLSDLDMLSLIEFARDDAGRVGARVLLVGPDGREVSNG